MWLTALAPLIWGSTYIVTTELLPADRPLLAATVRALPAGLVLLLFVRKLPQGAWRWRAVVLAVLNIGAFFPLLFLSAYRLPGGVSAIVGALQPFVAAGLGYPLLRLVPNPRMLVAGIVGLGGVTLIVLRATAAIDGLGLAAGAAGTLIMATGTVLGRRWGAPPEGLFALTSWQLAIGGLLLLPVTLGFEGLPATFTGGNALGFGYLAVVGAMLAYPLWFRGVTRLQPTQVSMLSLLSPVMAATLGWIVLGQALTGWQLVGAVLALGAVAVGATAPARVRAEAPVPELVKV
ncbi:EamA family transporter [Longispora sp. NPDC051575]|uniref:EamA family transporter n=1 Tax=Longispora sp. NPDC051575 TaxID=3154943 RepID=UPI0034178082